jgi:3-hydroxyacyl-[acyl-carrier-protein] dehydratase
VPPGERVVVKAEKVFWRRKKLRAKASLYLNDGTLAATASLSGIGVER